MKGSVGEICYVRLFFFFFLRHYIKTFIENCNKQFSKSFLAFKKYFCFGVAQTVHDQLCSLFNTLGQEDVQTIVRLA